MPENPDQAIPESNKLHNEDDGGSSQETPQPSLPANGAMGYPHNHIISSQCKERQATPPLQPLHPFERPQSKAERIMAWSTVGILIATVVNVGVAISQWQAMKRQADITETQLLASRRPWVDVDISIAGDWDYGAQGATISVRYKTKNYGTTPAEGVYISPNIVLWTGGGGIDVIAEQNKICEMGQRNPPINAIGGEVLFPGQESTENSGFHLSKEGIEKSLVAFANVSKNSTFIFPHIIGCVSYRFTFDGTVHKTPFIAQITRRGSIDSLDNSPDLRGIDTKLSKIPANMLSLRRMIFPGGSHAD
jgi:hypothetical protein